MKMGGGNKWNSSSIPMERIKKINFSKEQVLLVACCFLGLVLVSENIRRADFWLDEAAVYLAIQHPFSELAGVTMDYAQQFFYNFTLKAWSLVFGDSPAALRWFSALGYLGLIGTIYRTAGLLYKDKKTALLAAFMATTNYFLFWFALEAKGYTWATLIGLLAFHFFIKAFRSGTTKNYLTYAFLAALGFYCQPWLALVFISQGIFLLLFWKKARSFWKLFLAQILAAVLGLPFAYLTFIQGRLGVNSYAGTVDWSVVGKSLVYLSYGATGFYVFFSFLAFIFFLSKSSRFKALLKKLFLDQASKEGKTKKRFFVWWWGLSEESRTNLALFLYLSFPLLTAAGISHFLPGYVAGRYELVLLPAFLLLLARLWSKIEGKIWFLLLVATLLYSISNKIVENRRRLKSYQSSEKSVVEEIHSRAKNGDWVVTTSLSWATTYYYFGQLGTKKALNLVPYPEELRRQVVWMNDFETNRAENRPKYLDQAERLVNLVSESPNQTKIFLFYKFDRGGINDLLKAKFDERFSLVENFYPEDPRGAAWYDFVVIYKNKK